MSGCTSNITVIIPVYNNEFFLPKCLDSVLSQTLKKIEVICIDDGSTDNSFEILKNYEKKDERIRVYNVSHGGPSKARNIGIRKAKGKYVAFMDSDDWYFDNDVLQTLYLTAEEKKVNICGGSAYRTLNGRSKKSLDKMDFFTKDGYVKFEDYQSIWGFTRFIYRTSMLRKNHIYFRNYLRYEDPPFMLDVMLAAGEFYAIKKQVYCIRLRPGHVNWTHKKICECINGKAYVFHKSKQNKLENLHIKQFGQAIGQLEGIDITISDLRDKKIREAIEGMHREIDYGLLYRKGILKKYENIKTKILEIVLRKTIYKNWGNLNDRSINNRH